jgi:Lamin Tail Domain
MLLTLASVLAFAPQGPGPSTAPVVINEYSNDDSGTDNLEFVEIYNRTASPVDISGWTLTGEEGTAATAANGVFTFPGAAGSLTTVINPGQYIVVGQTAVPNVTFIVSGALPSLVLENGADGVALRDSTGTVIDSLVYGYQSWTAAVPTWLEGHGLWGQYILFDAAGFLPQGLLTPQRYVDGYDSNVNSVDFVMMGWTPGAANGTSQNLPLSFAENCDGAVGTIMPNVSHSFLGAQIFDPTAVTIATSTVRSYPPSPQGGNLARIQDPTGGGNVVQPQVVLGSSFLAEVYVYVTGSNPALAALAGQGESWAFGVAGTTNSYATATDVPGTYYAQASLCTGTLNNAPGTTGLAWMAFVSPTATNVYLVDLNGGGPAPFTVLAGPITATPGTNDGWQRLRLRVDNGNYVANFGGNYGVDDGQRFTGTTTVRTGAVYLQYRECVSSNPNLAGMYVDRLEIYGAVASNVLYAGTGSPTSAGTPVIAVNGGVPTVGNAALSVDGTSMFPFGVSLLSLDLGTLLPGVPVPGAQPALLLYANPTILATVFNSPAGTASYPLPLPPVNSLIGTVLSAQYFDFDFSLPFPLQVGSSGGAQITIGNS